MLGLAKFCQFDEEQILAGFLPKRGACAEFGARGRRGSNVAHLLDRGWLCQLIDRNINETLKDFPVQGARREKTPYGYVYRGFEDHEIVHATVTPENVNQVLWPDLDLLSIDIDGPDLEVWRAIVQCPAVVIIESNDTTSTKSDIVKLGKERGYRFVAKTGVNVILKHETQLHPTA